MAKDPPKERASDLTHGKNESAPLHHGDFQPAHRPEPLSFAVPELSQRPLGDAAHAANRWLSMLSPPSGFPEAKVDRSGIEFKSDLHDLQKRILKLVVPNYDGQRPKHDKPGMPGPEKPDKAEKIFPGGRHREKTHVSESGERRAPTEQPDRQPSDPHDKHVRSLADWHNFYRSQTRGNNCLPTSMSMMYADLRKGSPASDRELSQIERITNVGAHGGYAGSAQDIEHQAQKVIPGLKTEAYQSLDRKSLGAALDHHLDQGHSAIIGIKSPYTSGNNHYLYVAGKDSDGKYIIGDSGRHGGGVLGKTISRDDLLNRMMARNGGSRMIAGWLERQHTQGERTSQTPVQAVTGPPLHRDTSTTSARPDIWDRIRQPGDKMATHGERQQLYVGNAVVNMPKDLDASQPIHFVTYFNGFRSSHIEGYRSAELAKAMAGAPKNTVLISPRWQDIEHSENSSRRNFLANGGLRGVLNQVTSAVPELKRTGLDSYDTIGLVGFSAGYNPVGDALSDKAIAPKVTDIVMLDAPSSAVQRYVLNNLPAFITGGKRFMSVAGDWRDADYHQFSQEVAAGVLRLGYNPQSHIHRGSADNYHHTGNQSLIFLRTHASHGAIPGKHYRDVAF